MTPLRPRDIAARWQCSERHILNLIRWHDLPAFRIGGKLLRVPLDAVEAYERCHLNSGSSNTADGSMPHGGRTESRAAKRSVPAIVNLPSKR